LKVPNSVAFSPDGKKCYISATGSHQPQQYPDYQDLNVTNCHVVYAFDVVEKGANYT
jgi:sugar lactone lactonase YvrE